jgi:hypothetical protein
VQNPFVATTLTVVFYTSNATAGLLVYNVQFYGLPVLQVSTAQDITGLNAGDGGRQGTQVIIDGIGTSMYCPAVVWAYQRYNFQFQLNLNPSATYGVQGFIFKSPAGNNYPTQVTWWPPNSSPADLNSPTEINTNSAPMANGYQLITLSSPVTVNSNSHVTIGFQTEYWQSYLYQVQVIGTPTSALSDPGTTPILPGKYSNPNCLYIAPNNVEVRQFYQQYKAPEYSASVALRLTLMRSQ